MECNRIRERLSAYHDREISESDRRDVEAHLASCVMCRETLAGIESLSRLVAESPVPLPESLRRPRKDIFETPSRVAALERRIARRRAWTDFVLQNRWWFVAASVLILFAVIVGGFRSESRNDRTLSQAFLAYTTSFSHDSEAAGRVLVEHFGARKIQTNSLDALPFAPVALQQTPKGYTACEAYYVPTRDVPAVVTVLERKDGRRLAVFEQGPAPHGTARCPCGDRCSSGGRCVMHRIDDTLTVCSPCGRRFFTVIGASTEQEAEQLITWFAERLKNTQT
ncbi:hypothetical protein JCM19992_19000 [Thermostilla marina]